MRAVIKGIFSDEHNLDELASGRLTCLSSTLRIKIGPENNPSADDFELFVCTPDWINKNVFEPRWGRHMLIVREFNLEAITSLIEDYLDKCEGDCWNSIANKIARLMAWEFEDYKP